MTKSLRILFINRMASLERGGGETFDLEVARHLALLGHTITFLTGIPLFGKAKLPIDHGSNIQSVHLRSPYFGWFPWDKVKGGWRLRVADFTAFEWLAARWAYQHRDEFDIIQICELPNVVIFFKSKFQIPKSKIPKLVLRLTAPNYHDPRGGVPMADGVIASGTSLAKLRTRGLGRAVNVPNGVDTNRFQPQHSVFRAKHGISTEVTMLLYVARFQDFKNHAMLVRAFAEFTKNHACAMLVLAGSGPLQPRIRELAETLGVADKVLFLGEVMYDELPLVYAAADIKVVSSDYESFCFAAIEGMSSGLPVVTSDCGWVPGLIGDQLEPIQKEWVDAGSETDPPGGRFTHEVPGQRIRVVPGGMVVGRNDHLSMAAALHVLVNDGELRRQTGSWNREKAVREHGWISSATKLQDLYHSLLSGANDQSVIK